MLQNFKGTQGKWERIYSTTLNLPFRYQISTTQETDEEAEANAKLISASPLLAEALQAWVYYMDSDLSEAETILLAQTKQALKEAGL